MEDRSIQDYRAEQARDDAAAEEAYECYRTERVDVFCGCGSIDFDTRPSLRKKGWTIITGGQWCPQCTQKHVDSDTPFTVEKDDFEKAMAACPF